MRIALLVGINDYDNAGQLSGCVEDVQGLSPLLKEHGDGRRNFEVEELVSGKDAPVNESKLRSKIEAFFDVKGAEIALFYFAGHGHFDGRKGYLRTTDSEEGDWGVRMDDLIAYANDCDASERVIILDCCHAGAIDREFSSGGPAGIAEGVSILVASRNTEYAHEDPEGSGGVFTSLIRGALDGGAANPVTGSVTVAGLYAYVDGAVSRFKNEQSPIFKANLATFAELRRTDPVVDPRVVREITKIFGAPQDELPLDPAYEPTAPGAADPDKQAVFASLQAMRAASLVEPVGEKHMYFAAMNSKACRLTPLGRYYWRLVDSGRF